MYRKTIQIDDKWLESVMLRMAKFEVLLYHSFPSHI